MYRAAIGQEIEDIIIEAVKYSTSTFCRFSLTR